MECSTSTSSMVFSSRQDRDFSPRFYELMRRRVGGDFSRVVFSADDALDFRDAFVNLFERSPVNLLLYTNRAFRKSYYAEIAYFPSNAVSIRDGCECRRLTESELLPLWESVFLRCESVYAVACEGVRLPALFKESIPKDIVVYSVPDLLGDALAVARACHED